MDLFLPYFPFAVFPSSFPQTNFTQIFIFIQFDILNINQFNFTIHLLINRSFSALFPPTYLFLYFPLIFLYASLLLYKNEGAAILKHVMESNYVIFQNVITCVHLIFNIILDAFNDLLIQLLSNF